MEIFFLGVAIFGALLFTVSVWMMITNHYCCLQRSAIIKSIFANDEWRTLDEEFSQVSYSQHHIALATFRNWKELYSENIQKLMVP